MKRPFPIRYVDSVVPHALALEVSWADRAARKQGDLSAPIAAWVEVGQLGGMGGETIPPWKSGLAPLPPAFMDDGTLLFQFEEVFVDPRALTILENVLHYLHITGSRLASVRIASSLMATYRNVEDEFPPLYEPAPFVYEYGATDRRVAVEIEFEEDQADQVLNEVSGIATAWGKLGGFCGYADQGALPAGGYLILDSIDRFADMLTLTLQRKCVTDFAFDALVNMLHIIHARRNPLRAVRVL